MSQPRRCPYCQSSFLPSVFRPQQIVCGKPECQRRPQHYHRKKIVTDAEYHQVTWKVRSSGETNILTIRNSVGGRTRNCLQTTVNVSGSVISQKRRLRRRLLDKNNLALDLKHSASEVWLLGPKLRDLDKNSLASAQVLILPSLSFPPPVIDPS